MSIPKANPGEIIDIQPLGDKIAESKTRALLKTDGLEVIRLVLPAGKEIPVHKAPSVITVQCLEGRVAFTTMGATRMLTPGSLLFLPAKEPHSLQAEEDSSLLVTLHLQPAE